MHPRDASVGEPVSRLALQAAVSVLPCWSKAGSSAILRPSVLTLAISVIGGVVTMRGAVAQPNNGISVAVEDRRRGVGGAGNTFHPVSSGLTAQHRRMGAAQLQAQWLG